MSYFIKTVDKGQAVRIQGRNLRQVVVCLFGLVYLTHFPENLD